MAEQLDHLGVQYIEGGWPGANPKDEEFFRRAAAGELHLHTATLVAFGSTRKAGGRAETDPVLRQPARRPRPPAVCIVAKSAERHVTETLRTTLDEAVDMVADSVAFLRAQGLRVFLDAEHFFDGYKANPGFSLDVLRAAEEAGAEVLVLCDTNGGTLPYEVERIVGEVRDAVGHQARLPLPQRLRLRGGQLPGRRPPGRDPGPGLHQRLRRADRQRRPVRRHPRPRPSRWACGPSRADRLERLTPVAHHIAELVNIAPDPHQPYVGGVGLRPQGRAAHQRHRPGPRRLRARRPRRGRQRHPLRRQRDGRPLDPAAEGRPSSASTSTARCWPRCSRTSSELEHRGYHFEVADGSLELLMRAATGWKQAFFRLESFRVITEQREDGAFVTEATIKVHVGDERVLATAEGNGPVNALDAALRKAIGAALSRSWPTST